MICEWTQLVHTSNVWPHAIYHPRLPPPGMHVAAEARPEPPFGNQGMSIPEKSTTPSRAE